MFLATTGATELWDKADEILVLGPGCLRYVQRNEWRPLKWSMLPNPWDDPHAIEEAERYCCGVIDALLDDLGRRLDEIHETRHSKRYWRILLGPWLMYYVHALYDRYISLKRAFEAAPALRTVALGSLSYVTPANTADFLRLAYSEPADLFNLQLYSQVLRALGLEAVIAREVDSPLRGSMAPPAAGGLRKPVLQLIRALVLAIRPRVMLGGVDLTRRQMLCLVGEMRGRALPVPSTTSVGWTSVDSATRKRLAEVRPWDEFTSVLIWTLQTNVPTIYIEGYGAFRRECLKMWPARPSVAVASAAWYGNEPFKFLAAEFGERGARLVGIQHGGGYGTSRLLPQERFELSITDRWWSFGWSCQESEDGDKIHPISHPRFLPLINIRSSSSAKREILFVTTSHPRYVYRFESQPSGEFERVLAWRERFIKSLTQAQRALVTVRLRTDDYDWCQRQRLLDACGRLRFSQSGRPLRHALRRARLAVVEYYGTAYLETLAANIPQVVFWEERLWEVRDEARPHFENLRAAEILFNSPEAAAAKVSRIYEAPWTWWETDAVQGARAAFLEHYASGKKDWLEHWVRLLEQEGKSALREGV